MYTIVFTLVAVFMRLDYVQPTQGPNVEDEYSWDLLIYTQEWPETVCKEWIHNNPHHTCKLPKKEDSWAIHGIWPTKFGTRGPAFCNRTWLFDPEEIRPIEDELLEKWTNIEDGTGQFSFLAHEWNKHGTCAAVLEPLNSQIKYFNTGLKWFAKYDMTTLLASEGVVPDDDKKYSVTDFYSAVKNQLGVNPSIQCRFENGNTYLVEIRICFDKDLVLHDCDGTEYFDDGILRYDVIDGVKIITNCKNDGILYLHNRFPPKSLYIQLLNLITWLSWVTL